MNFLILSLSHFLHILATVVWFGGIIMILLVILPGVKAALESSSLIKKLMGNITKRFTPMANISIFVLIITGVIITYYDKDIISVIDLNNPWNVIMYLKHFFIILMVIIHFYRGLILNPKIKRLSSQNIELQVKKLKKLSLNLVKTNFILGLVVLMLTGILSSL